jgi:hypothetical protein
LIGISGVGSSRRPRSIQDCTARRRRGEEECLYHKCIVMSQSFVSLYTKAGIYVVVFFFKGMYCLKITLPLNSTVTSTLAKCPDGHGVS